MISTGNLQADYAITYTVQSIYTLIHLLVVHFHKFLIDYPDIASAVLVIGGAVLAYYILKNLVRIIYSVLVTALKLLVVLSVLFVALWVYVRGIDVFVRDFRTLVDFTANFNAEEGAEQAQRYGQDAKNAWGLLSKWAASSVQ